jgi:hypothetical protein
LLRTSLRIPLCLCLGSGGGGANKLAREVTDALATMPAAVEAVAGKEMGALLKEYLAP